MSICRLPPFICVLFSTFLISIFIKHAKDRRLIRIATLFYLSIIWWQGSWVALFSLSNNPQAADIVARIGYSGIVFIVPFYIDFIYYCGFERPTRLAKVILYLSCLFLPFIWFSDLFVAGVWNYYYGYYPKCGPLHLIHLALAVVGIVFCALQLSRNIHRGHRPQESRSALVSFILFSFSSVDYAFNWGVEVYPFGWLFVLASFAYTLYTIIFSSFADLAIVRKQLEEDIKKALQEKKTLQGFIPICARCKNIRDDQGYWNQIEQYIREHSEAEFTHSVCPDCAEELYGDLLREDENKDEDENDTKDNQTRH